MHQPQIIPFDTFEEMQDIISTGIERANARTLPRQQAITYGDYWMRLWGDILIFGYIDTREELDAEERRLGATEEEIAYEHEAMDHSYNNGFRFGRAYSVIEPRGELGDTHISEMVPLTKEEFEDAKRLNWDFENIIQTRWFRTAVERLAS